MSKVRLLVGARKGAFVLTSDGKRKDWEVAGPFFAGWEIYHVAGSPADPDRVYASQTSGWFGQIIQRSDDGGKTWHQPGTPPGKNAADPDGTPRGESNKFVYDTQKRRAFIRFFAYGNDLFHEPQDAPLPKAVATGEEPFRIVGAIAGARLKRGF